MKKEKLNLFSHLVLVYPKLHLEVLSQLQDRYRDLPLISIGRKIDGIGNVLIDNKTGIKDLLKHLFVHSWVPENSLCPWT